MKLNNGSFELIIWASHVNMVSLLIGDDSPKSKHFVGRW